MDTLERTIDQEESFRLRSALRHYAGLAHWGGSTRGIRKRLAEAADRIEKLESERTSPFVLGSEHIVTAMSINPGPGETRTCGNCGKAILGPGSWGIDPNVVCQCCQRRR